MEGAIAENFRRIWKQAYPNFILGSRPRAFDFRHHFAWANLNRWAAEMLDVNVMLPYLMRYMGHQSISNTLYYFHFVPDFLPIQICQRKQNVLFRRYRMNKDSYHSSLIFWDTAKEYLYHHLLNIRKASPNTIASYRDGLNLYIDYLEQQKNLSRKNISFSDCSRENMNDYLDWMLNIRKLAEKTCNLRLTAIHSFLECASNEYAELMPIYLNACSVKE